MRIVKESLRFIKMKVILLLWLDLSNLVGSY